MILNFPNLGSCFCTNLTSTAKTTTLKSVSIRVSSISDNPAKQSKKNTADLLSGSGGRFCSCCSRRRFMGSVLETGLLPINPSCASENNSASDDPVEMLSRIHPPRPGWYEALYAFALDKLTKRYEAEIAGYKTQLFSNLKGKANKILEVGIGTGPNLKYYANDPQIHVFGVDPISKMKKYAEVAAHSAGLPLSNFTFTQAVAEALPLDDSSVDAVIGTLVLCSVKDVDLALQAAKDGTIRRFVQGVLDPLQQIIADGCHLTRNTGNSIAKAGFSVLDINEVFVSSASIINPHVYGIAQK